jgi:hypothetical protein
VVIHKPNEGNEPGHTLSQTSVIHFDVEAPRLWHCGIFSLIQEKLLIITFWVAIRISKQNLIILSYCSFQDRYAEMMLSKGSHHRGYCSYINHDRYTDRSHLTNVMNLLSPELEGSVGRL